MVNTSKKIQIQNENAFQWLKFESGTHRVQRVPKTEKNGRMHTSTASVILQPNFDTKLLKNIELKSSDLAWEFFRATGAGGQKVNKTSSAVRLRYSPLNIIIESQEERYLEMNKQNALHKLKQK